MGQDTNNINNMVEDKTKWGQHYFEYINSGHPQMDSFQCVCSVSSFFSPEGNENTCVLRSITKIHPDGA